MEAFNNLLIVNIVFLLLQCTSYMHADCVTRQYRTLPDGFNVFLQKGIQPAFNTVKTDYQTECALLCTNEISCRMWRFGDGHCQIFDRTKDKITVVKSSNTTMNTYLETRQVFSDKKWFEIYFVKKGSGFKVSKSFWGQGNYMSLGPVNCTQNICPDFFRSILIDFWSKLPIKKVKLSLIKNNKEVLNLIFDGQGTTVSNWFMMDRVLESPWKDLGKGSKFNFFDVNHKNIRSFYISQSHAGCPGDIGWLCVAELPTICSWEKLPTYPQFIYSDKDTATQWEKERAFADSLAIYISF